MAKLGVQFNPADQEPRQAFDPLPPGWYNMEIDESEMVPASDPKKGGDQMKLRFTILDEGYVNRKVFTRLLIDFQNADDPDKAETTRRIARETLSAICLAIGFTGELEDTNQLHGIPMQGKLKIRPAQGNYDAQNEITGFKATEGATPSRAASPARPGAGRATPPARPAAGGAQRPAASAAARPAAGGTRPAANGARPAAALAARRPAPAASVDPDVDPTTGMPWGEE